MLRPPQRTWELRNTLAEGSWERVPVATSEGLPAPATCCSGTRPQHDWALRQHPATPERRGCSGKRCPHTAARWWRNLCAQVLLNSNHCPDLGSCPPLQGTRNQNRFLPQHRSPTLSFTLGTRVCLLPGQSSPLTLQRGTQVGGAGMPPELALRRQEHRAGVLRWAELREGQDSVCAHPTKVCLHSWLPTCSIRQSCEQGCCKPRHCP